MGIRVTRRVLNYHSESKDYFSGAITSSDDYIIVTRSRVGADNPKYKDNIRRGVGAANAMDAYKQSVGWQSGAVHFTRKSLLPKGAGSVGRLGPASVIPPGIPAGLSAEATNKAAIGIRNKIHSQSTSVTGLLILGEARKTMQMIRHPADAIVKLLEKFVSDHERGLEAARRQRILNLRRKAKGQRAVPGYVYQNGSMRATADTVAKSWLELVFGLEPLMSDIASVAEASLAKHSAPTISRLTFTAQAESATSLSSQVPVGPCWCPREINSTDEVSCRFVVGYRTAISGHESGLGRVIDQSGFNLREVIPTAWEMLPWSFLIDYVSNIGDVISANLVSMENVAWAYKVTRRSARKSTNLLGSKGYIKPIDAYYWKFDSGSDYRETSSIVEVKREAASIPFGELRFSLPEKESQYKNMAALLWLQLKS